MKLDKNTLNLIVEMENLIGKECFNPKSYNGWTKESGLGYRYPISILTKNGELVTWKFHLDNPTVSEVEQMRYKFGSNHLFIGSGLINVLNFLEERYKINFNELEDNLGKSEK